MRSPAIFIASCVLAAPSLAGGGQEGACPDIGPVQHWSGAGSSICPCFVAGEEVGATFNLPPGDYPVEILRVGVGWGSVFGGSPDQLENAIKVYAGGLPNPGTPIANLPGPVLSDGFINEFDLEPLPGQIVVNSGPVTVTLEFAQPSGGLGPAPSFDGDGCQGGGRNVVFAIPGGWSDACVLGVSGDWQFHVVYRSLNCGPTGPGSPTCFGVGCPCGNDDGSAGCANSTGFGGLLTATGTNSQSADDLNLVATGLPPSNNGLFYMGDTLVSNQFFDGIQCALGTTFRFLTSIQNSGPFGEMSFTGVVAASGGLITPGSTWHFHAWHRDVPGTPCGTGSNLTNIYSVTFTP